MLSVTVISSRNDLSRNISGDFRIQRQYTREMVRFSDLRGGFNRYRQNGAFSFHHYDYRSGEYG